MKPRNPNVPSHHPRRPGASRRRPPPGAGPTLLAGLTAVTLVVMVVLAYQAHDAASSHREVAHQAVSDLASAAAWQFAARGSNRVLELVRESLAEPLQRLAAGTGAAPTLPEWAEASEEWDRCRCVNVERPATFFMLERGAVEVHGAPLTDDARAWLAGKVGEQIAAARESQGEAGHPGGGVLVRSEGSVSRAYVYFIPWTLQGREMAYGWVTDARDLAEATFGRLTGSTDLLPPSLTGGAPADSLFALEVRDPDGILLLASEGPGGVGAVVAGGDRFPPWAGDLEVAVLVPADRAEFLVIGGLPASRLPLILTLLVLAAGLLMAAVLLLRQRYRLARLRSDFVAGVTHELRTPLAQIRMFAELLSMGKLTSGSERDRALRVIDEESRRLDHLIDNVLGFAGMGVSARPPSSRPVEMDELLQEVVERFRPLSSERRASVELHAEPGLRALADRDAVHRIVLNLLDNAVKYGPRGQVVRVEAGRRDGWARIQVEDQGPGVPPGERRRIWDPYVRLPNPDRADAAGSGIGLAVVRGLVEGHGGWVMVEDAPGGGARFVVLLPLAENGTANADPLQATAGEAMSGWDGSGPGRTEDAAAAARQGTGP